MYVCMYVCMYVVCVCIYIYIYEYNRTLRMCVNVCTYGERSIIYLSRKEGKERKSVHVGTCLEVSHMQPQLSAILSE